MGPDERRLLEIPLAKVRSMAAHPVTRRAGEGAAALGSGNQLAGRCALHDDVSIRGRFRRASGAGYRINFAQPVEKGFCRYSSTERKSNMNPVAMILNSRDIR